MFTKKLIRSLSIFLAVGIIMSGCSKTSETSEAAPLQTEQAETESQTTSEITETTKPEPTGFEDYIDETVPNNKIPVKDIDVSSLRDSSVWFSGVGLGYGNPRLLKCVRNFFSNQSLGTEDVQTYSGVDGNYDAEFKGVTTDNFDYIRYVLEENGLRLFIDEVPYEFFVEKFPDYVDISNKDKYADLDREFVDYFYFNTNQNGYNGNLVSMTCDSSNIDKIRLATFDLLVRYNVSREAIATNISDNDDKTTKYGYIETGLTPDGRYVWCPTKLQYRVVQNDVKRLPKCENVDILIPETREDLIASGIDVEKYDEMCEKVFGGAKMEGSTK